MRDYFSLFGLSQDYNLDSDALETAYNSLRKQFHPDRFVVASPQERYQAEQYAAYINQGYQTLRCDVDRGNYLIGLLGRTVDFERETISDSQFLMQQLQWREMLEELENSSPDQEEQKLQREQLIHQVSDSLDTHTRVFTSEISEQKLAAATNTLLKMHFLKRLLLQAKDTRKNFVANTLDVAL